jgi:ELWxxDGT repeat protein
MTDIVRHIILVAIVLSLPLASARADTSAALIKDIQPGPTGSSLRYLVDVDGTLFFTADDGVTGEELWKSDGTEAGTVLVKDIVPGPDGSSCTRLTKVGGTLFFSARTDATGTELWKSDGTEAGTVLVKDIIPGSISSTPTDLIDFNGTLIFVARVPTGMSTRELLKSDGTAAGTVLVNDFTVPGSYYPPLFPPTGFRSYLTIVNGTLFFKARTSYPNTGWELWKTDGTALGTVMVKDIDPGPGDSTPSVLTEVNGTLFFAADLPATGFELWKSDGTEAGTLMVKDILPGIYGSFPYDPDVVLMVEFEDKLYFSPDDGVHGHELWVSDGTPADRRRRHVVLGRE